MNPELGQDLSLLHLIWNASLPVQFVMLLLLGASLMSWWVIFIKLFALKRARQLTDRFEQEFWGGSDLNALYQRISSGHESVCEMARIFEAGFREFMKLRGQPGQALNVILDGTRRAMRATYQRELDSLESHLSFLATVGSVSPYVGLFGTVWGIMIAFIWPTAWKASWRSFPTSCSARQPRRSDSWPAPASRLPRSTSCR
ncbi:MAG: MotA/TolQ/ExbB proton channel family [Proteobacteria bacterium]|nr:MotA/TolQ/ExbB proton channel family [Pseudomonadota bacterium]